ncbi:MAG: PEP-CTERM sorting domain-containing protein [Fimbriimonadaceae bacterium]
MRSTKLAKLGVGALLAALPLSAMATDVPLFYFGDSDGNPITSLTIGLPGSTFDVTVFYTTNLTHTGMNLFVGYDTATSEGLSATPLDGKIGLGGASEMASVTYVHPTIGMLFTPAAAGGFGSGNHVRPFGLDIPMGTGLNLTEVPGATASALVRISLKNLGLAAGESYTLSIFDAGDNGADIYTTFLDYRGTYYYPSTSYELTVQAVPEPGTLLALAAGAGLFLRRRRK